MRRLFCLAWISIVAVCPPALAAPGGVPARPISIGNWGPHDPEEPEPGSEPWTPADVAGFLELYPQAYFELGHDSAKPPGNKKWSRTRERLGELRSTARARGVDTASRLCVNERPDVLIRNAPNVHQCTPLRGGGGCDWEGDMDGRHGEPETFVKLAGQASGGAANALIATDGGWAPDLWVHRLVVLRPGSPGEERRRVTANDGRTLFVTPEWNVPPRAGDPYEVRGSFDPAWVARVTPAAHREALERLWLDARDVCDGPCAPPAESLDPFEAERGFEPWIDREAVSALRTSTSVPALYGYTYDAGADSQRIEDPYFRANGVVMDLTNAAYRAWRARYLLYKLEDYGFEPGEPVCLAIAYKPGFHTYHDPVSRGVNPDPCAVPGSNNWVGPARVCRDGRLLGGPLHFTPYRAGQFEAGISAYFRELASVLASAGYRDVRVITGEAPNYMGATWSALASDVRMLPMLYGEQGGWLNPPRSALAALAGETPGEPPSPPPTEGGASGPVVPPPSAPNPSPVPAAPTPPPSGSGASAPTPGSGETGSAPSAPAAPPSAPASSDASSATAGGAASAPGATTRTRGFVTSGGGGGGTVEPPGAR